MQFFIGYHTAYDYHKSSYGQESTFTQRGPLKYVPWDGQKSFKTVLRDAEPRFYDRAMSARVKSRNPHGDHTFRFEIVSLKVGTKASSVTIPIDKQVIPIQRM